MVKGSRDERSIATLLIVVKSEPGDVTLQHALRQASLPPKSGGLRVPLRPRWIERIRARKSMTRTLLAERGLPADPGQVNRLRIVARRARAAGFPDIAMWAEAIARRASGG